MPSYKSIGKALSEIQYAAWRAVCGVLNDSDALEEAIAQYVRARGGYWPPSAAHGGNHQKPQYRPSDMLDQLVARGDLSASTISSEIVRHINAVISEENASHKAQQAMLWYGAMYAMAHDRATLPTRQEIAKEIRAAWGADVKDVKEMR